MNQIILHNINILNVFSLQKYNMDTVIFLISLITQFLYIQ